MRVDGTKKDGNSAHPLEWMKQEQAVSYIENLELTNMEQVKTLLIAILKRKR